MQKSKIWGISRWSASLSFDWTFVSFLSYVNPFYDNFQVISYVLKLDETIETSHVAISRRGKREGKKVRVEGKEKEKKKKNDDNKQR